MEAVLGFNTSTFIFDTGLLKWILSLSHKIVYYITFTRFDLTSYLGWSYKFVMWNSQEVTVVDIDKKILKRIMLSL